MLEKTLIKYRKAMSNLRICGSMIIIFGAWSVIKGAMYYFFDAEDFFGYIGLQDMEMQQDAGVLAFVVMVVILAIDLGFRAYVGRSAVKEGKGKKKNAFYVVVTFCMLAVSIASLTYYAADGMYIASLADHIVSELVEITNAGIMIEIAASSIIVKKLRKEYPELEN